MSSSGGTISGAQYDAIELQYIGNNTFTVLNYAGDLTVTCGGYVYQGGLTWMPVTHTVVAYNSASPACNNLGWRMSTLAELTALYNSGAANGQSWNLWSTLSSTQGLNGPGGHTALYLNNGTPKKSPTRAAPMRPAYIKGLAHVARHPPSPCFGYFVLAGQSATGGL